MVRVHTFLAIIAGLALRLLFVLKYPASTGDSAMYLRLARDWTDHHIYGMWLGGHLVPTDLRVPGYPAFLAGVAMLLGRSIRTISLSQIIVDLGTCLLTAAIAAALAPSAVKKRVWIAATWLAATCPFVANYSAVVLTEVLSTFLATAAMLYFVLGLRERPADLRFRARAGKLSPVAFVSLGAFLTGMATLVRPEMPLLLAVAAIVYAVCWRKLLNLRKAILFGAAIGGAFFLPLMPWAVRNFVTLHEFQIVAPRYATLPEEYAPVGYYAWTGTWLERFRDVYSAIWKIGEEPLAMDDLPASAFDSPQEKARVQALLQQYNDSPDLDISPELDREFAKLARERTRRNSLRTYFRVPLQRVLTLWFTPRTELLPIDGTFWPVREQWRDSRANVLITGGFAALGYLYAALALGGIWMVQRARRARDVPASPDAPNFRGVALLVAYLLVRTAFLVTVEAPEPRYVVSCYPLVLALISMIFIRNRQKA